MDCKTNKLVKIFNLFAFLSLGAAFVTLLLVLGVNAWSFIGKAFSYTYGFISNRAWDTSKIIGVCVAVVALICWVVWFVTGQLKTKGNTTVVGPLLVLLLPFLGLVLYHYRNDIEKNLANSSTRPGFIALFVLLAIFLVFGILSIVFGISKDVKIAKQFAAEQNEEIEDEDECDCCCASNEDLEKIHDEVMSVRNDVDELKKRVNSLKVVKNEPAVEEAVKENVAKKVVVRRPFVEKMADADQEIKENYDILKNELLSYGVKSRLSSGGDTFRLKRETYALITLVGKNLKIYLALNPQTYEGTTIPAKDESGKKRYAEVPTMLRIKSKLSIKRAKVLIADLMKAKGLEQDEVLEVKYSKEMKSKKPRKAVKK